MQRAFALVLILTAGALCAPAVLLAQQFEAAVVKPASPSNEPFGDFTLPPGRVAATSMTLRELLERAHGLPAFRLDGGPEWMSSARFDVSATAGAAVSSAQMLRMLQQLLDERFALRRHVETRQGAVYEMVAARQDRRLGPKIAPSAIDCTTALAGRAVLDRSPITAGPPQCLPESSFKVGPAGALLTQKRMGMTMASLAEFVVPFARRVVFDKTGLTGAFDIELSFSPEAQYILNDGGPLQTAPPSDGGSIQTALQEQLGLKLQSARGPVDIMVIDAAAPPAGN